MTQSASYSPSQVAALTTLALADGLRVVVIEAPVSFSKRVGMSLTGSAKTIAVIIPAGTYSVSDGHYEGGDILIASLESDTSFVAPEGTL